MSNIGQEQQRSDQILTQKAFNEPIPSTEANQPSETINQKPSREQMSSKNVNSDDEILRKNTVIQVQHEDRIINGNEHVVVNVKREIIKFETKSQRKKFVKIVFSLVLSMLIVCMLAGALPFIHPPIKVFFNEYPWIFYIASVLFSAIYILVVCVRPIRQKSPYNWITLVIFTLIISFFVICLCARYDLKTIGISLLATAVASIAIILYATFTKTDFTTCYALLFGISAVLISFSIVVLISQFVLPSHTFHILHLVYSCIGAVGAVIYFIFDVQLIMGRKKNAIAPDEYVLGAILIFTDMLVLFTYITGIVGSAQQV